MAASTGKGSRGKPAAKRKTTKPKETKATLQAKKQMWAVVLFALGILLVALTFIKGDKLWLSIHNALFGMLGWSVYFISPLILYIAVSAAMDRPLSSIKAKLWQVAVLIVMISGAIQVFGTGLPDEGKLVSNVVALYEGGKDLTGGGVAAAIFAVPLMSLFGKLGASIIIVLAIFVFAMLITGSTLIGLYHWATQPVRKIEEDYTEKVKEKPAPKTKPKPPAQKTKAVKPPKSAQPMSARSSPKFNIDVPIDEKPVQAEEEALADDITISGDIPGQADDITEDSLQEAINSYKPPARAVAERISTAEDNQADSDGDYMPGHPVVSETSGDDSEDYSTLMEALAEYEKDKPTEYISPEEFAHAPIISKEPEDDSPLPENVILFPGADRSHPLDDDIMEALGVFEEELSSPPENPQPWDTPQQWESPEEEIITESLAEPQQLPEDIITEEAVPDSPPAIAPVKESLPFSAVKDEPVTYEEISIAEDIAPVKHAYQHPPVSLLNLAKSVTGEDVNEELKANGQILVDTLKSFGVQTRITHICRGPAVTRYEVQPSAGVKISKITNLADDIALNLASAGIRIEAPIPNKPAVGIEVPNKVISTVSIRDIIDSKEFNQCETSVPIALGKDIAGNITIADIGKMPHMLIAGATGSGKSVCINSIIISLLYKSSPDEVKLLMVDPKVVELGVYNGIPHLLIPVVTEPKKAAGALNWAVTEMLNRYKAFADNSVRDLAGYNRLAETREDLAPMPKIVIIIDELADLMMAAPNEVEDAICRLAQMARAAGMHLVIATQRPSVDVITGVIKANIPSRIAFAVSSQVDSRTILDMGGAEKLLGRGDMLFYPVGAAKPIRVQGCFVSDTEVEKVVGFVKANEATAYDQNIADEIDKHIPPEKGSKNSSNDGGGFDDEDEMLPQAIECVVEMGQASTSSLQRRLKLGYARAARIIDQLEERGIVGPFEGSKPRQVLITKDQWLQMKLSSDK